MDFVSARLVQDDCAHTRIETGLRSLRTRRSGPVVGRQKVGAHARLFVDRDEKRRALADGNKGGGRWGPGAQRPGDRVRERQNNPGPSVSLTLVYGRRYTWKVSSASAILCRTRHRPFYPAGREMSRRSDFSSSDTDLSREWRPCSCEFRSNDDVGLALAPLYAFYRGRLHHQRESFSRGLAVAFSGIPCAI